MLQINTNVKYTCKAGKKSLAYTECLKSSRTQSLYIYFSVMANDRHPWLHATHAGNVAEDC
jgi:hypothetical protein